VRIASGRLFALFSFDVGYEIDLERLRGLLAEGARAGMGGERRAAPARAEYQLPPLVLPAGERDLVLAERPVRAGVALRIHEFGAVTVVFEIPFDNQPLAELPGLTAALTIGGGLEGDARAVLREAFPRIAPAVSRPDLEGHRLVEDYYVLHVAHFEPAADAAALLGPHRDLLARILHCEPERLSASEIDEVLRTAVTYTPDDLVVTDWNVALVYDEEAQDVLNVLELLNVQLLELRFLDGMLDRRMGALYEHAERPPGLLAFRREAERARELAVLRLDTATLRERMINALKLTGDLYLTKIYARTAERLHLSEWQRSLDGKLELVQRIYDVFTTRAATARTELLELTIVILIAIDIVLYLAF
jgi:hypothetical protein